jgi:hypothetical protein
VTTPQTDRIPIDTALIGETVALACGVMAPTRILPPDLQLAELERLLRSQTQLLIAELDQAGPEGVAVCPRARAAVASARTALDRCPGEDDGGLHTAVRLTVLGTACAALLTVHSESGDVR